MLRIASVVLFSIACLACSKSKEGGGGGGAAGSAPAPGSAVAVGSAEGSAMAAGSAEGSAMAAGSAEGSAMAAGSAEGSAAAGSAAAGSGAGEGSAVAAGSAAPSDFEFDKLSHDDKIKFMKQKVMPAMKPLFQKFDAKEFGNFTCKTCHGKDPQKSKYEMPNPELPKLDFDALKAGKEDPKMVEFMSKVVKPEMAKLLNEPEMSESEPKGFGCLDCHMMKKK